MRVLHIDTGTEMRGGQRQVLLLLNLLKRSGHEPVLLSPEASPLAEAARAGGFAVFGALLGEVWQRSKQVDIVHAHDARGHSLAAIACRRRFVVSRRVAFPVRRSIFSRWKYGRAARFLAVSHFVARGLQAAGIPKEKIDVVYDGVEPCTPAPEWDASFPVVALASTDAQKGRDLVEQAAELAHVPVLFSDHLAQDLRRASLFLYITRSEGLGSAALLAMSMGVPVIASHTGGLPEIVAHSECGMLVQNKPAEIAAAIRDLLSNATLAQRFSERGKAVVAEHFTAEHLLQGTLACYERALAG